jgi:hypothetical protein
LESAGNKSAAKMEMMAITVSNSIKVNPSPSHQHEHDGLFLKRGRFMVLATTADFNM